MPDHKPKIIEALDVSKALVVINVALFMAMVASSGLRSLLWPPPELLLKWGANLGAFTVNGQYWRLFTSMFVHGNVFHLGLNMYALWVFGPSVSELFGPRRYLVVYLVSGIAGALASTVWNPAQTSAGASGALVGIAGAMLATMVRGSNSDSKVSRYSQPLIFFGVICASLLYGFFMPEIDNAAHVGGLAGGFLAGLALQPRHASSSRLKTVAFSLVFAASVFLISALCLSEAKADKRSTNYQATTDAITNLNGKKFSAALEDYNELLKSDLNPTFFVGRAEAEIGLKQYQLAVKDCEKAIAMNPREPYPYLKKAQANHCLGNDIDAVEDLGTVIKISPKATGFNARAWYEIALGRFDEGMQDVNESLRLDPNSSAALDTRGVAFFCIEKPEKALTDFERSIALKPKEGAGYFHRAMIYDQIGKTGLAEMDRNRAKALDYQPDPWELKLQERNSRPGRGSSGRDDSGQKPVGLNNSDPNSSGQSNCSQTRSS